MNTNLKSILESMDKDIDALVKPETFETREEMGDAFTDFLGYDPTRYWDRQMMSEQVIKLGLNTKNYSTEECDEVIDKALDHYDAVKSNLMLQVAQKTVKEVLNQEVTADDLNLDLEYLLDTEIFGTGYDDEEDEDDESLLDELEDDEEDDSFDDIEDDYDD